MSILHKLVQKKEENIIPPKSFHKAWNTLKAKSDKDIKRQKIKTTDQTSSQDGHKGRHGRLLAQPHQNYN